MADREASTDLVSRYIAWGDRAPNHWNGRGRVSVVILPVLFLIVAVIFLLGTVFEISGETRALLFAVLVYLVVPIGAVTYAVLRYMRRLKAENEHPRA